MEEKLLKPSEAAEVIGITKSAVWYAIYNALISVRKSGPYTLISREEAERYKKDRPKKGRPKKGNEVSIRKIRRIKKESFSTK